MVRRMFSKNFVNFRLCIYDSFDKGDKCVSIFFNSINAFGTMNHIILSNKLCMLSKKWITYLMQSYPSSRKQRIKIGNVTNEHKK